MLSSTMTVPCSRHARSYATERCRALHRRRLYASWALASVATTLVGLAVLAQ